MHVDGGVAVLAQEPAAGIARAAVDLVMQIVFDEQVLLEVCSLGCLSPWAS
jgi:hypothetical protein